MKTMSLKETLKRSKALTWSRTICTLMLIVIIGMLLVISYQRGQIAGYEAEAARHHAEKEKKPLEQPMFRAL